ncbi:hypothetical protein NDU88_006939 [Pleurodeles waltl]|uniref:Uncharacterized protein n=1 Tax=Pleurodeles waltl TaxID=8319 RepID=A0AAV7UNG6_PLEWA|nr:hypothetical protein NDU88_006939 [Pleurodeles waltl]
MPAECGIKRRGPKGGGDAQQGEVVKPAVLGEAPRATAWHVALRCLEEQARPKGSPEEKTTPQLLDLKYWTVMVDGKALTFSDPQKLQQFTIKKEAKGQQQNTKAAGDGEAAEEMEDVE